MMATNDHSYRILITDDDNRCREALRDIIAPQGYETLEAACGEEAVDMVRNGVEVHLVLLDMHMPTITGIGDTSTRSPDQRHFARDPGNRRRQRKSDASGDPIAGL